MTNSLKNYKYGYRYGFALLSTVFAIAIIVGFGLGLVGCGVQINVDQELILRDGLAWTDRHLWGVGNSDGYIFRGDGTYLQINDYSGDIEGQWVIYADGAWTINGDILTLIEVGETAHVEYYITSNEVLITYWRSGGEVWMEAYQKEDGVYPIDIPKTWKLGIEHIKRFLKSKPNSAPSLAPR